LYEVNGSEQIAVDETTAGILIGYHENKSQAKNYPSRFVTGLRLPKHPARAKMGNV
jgi:hypothetical protein